MDEKSDRHVSERVIPTPSTVSPEMRDFLEKPLNPLFKRDLKREWEWNDIFPYVNSRGIANLEIARKIFPAATEEHMLGGVKAYVVTPKQISEENRDKVLIHIHRGGFVSLCCERSLPEPMAMAFYGKFKVITPDYRMPPDFPFPAPLEDSIAVYQEVIKTYKPSNIGIFGTSSGGGLAVAMIQRLQMLGLPLPAAAAFGFPWTDLTKTGDSYYTNDEIDNVLVSYDGMVAAWAKFYAGSYDLKDPCISPIYGEFNKEFPPSLVITGTRDLFLSNTVRLLRKLRQSAVECEMQIFEGMPHAFYAEVLQAPESKEAYHEMILFFQKHLGKS